MRAGCSSSPVTDEIFISELLAYRERVSSLSARCACQGNGWNRNGHPTVQKVNFKPHSSRALGRRRL